MFDRQQQVPVGFMTHFTHIDILYCDLSMTGIHCAEFKTGVICSCLLVRVTSRAVEFRTLSRRPISVLVRPYRAALLVMSQWLGDSADRDVARSISGQDQKTASN